MPAKSKTQGSSLTNNPTDTSSLDIPSTSAPTTPLDVDLPHAIEDACDKLKAELLSIFSSRMKAIELTLSELHLKLAQQSSSITALETEMAIHRAQPSPSYSTAVSLSPPIPPTQSLKDNKSALATVHWELADLDRRRPNVVVRGLAPVVNIADAEVFCQLCEDFLPIKPAVVSCRRAGTPASGRIQPLIVTLRSEQAALELIDSSKMLRRCSNDYVRSNVFFNKDLTPAAAYAAYLARVARRSRVTGAGHVTDITASGSQRNGSDASLGKAQISSQSLSTTGCNNINSAASCCGTAHATFYNSDATRATHAPPVIYPSHSATCLHSGVEQPEITTSYSAATTVNFPTLSPPFIPRQLTSSTSTPDPRFCL